MDSSACASALRTSSRMSGGASRLTCGIRVLPVAGRAAAQSMPPGAERQSLRGLPGSVVKDKEQVGRDGQLCVRLALIVGEFNFVRAVQQFDDRADLAAHETVRWHVRQESDDVQ